MTRVLLNFIIYIYSINFLYRDFEISLFQKDPFPKIHIHVYILMYKETFNLLYVW